MLYYDKDWPGGGRGVGGEDWKCNVHTQELELLLVLGPERHVKGHVPQLRGHPTPAVSLLRREMTDSMAVTARATTWLC